MTQLTGLSEREAAQRRVQGLGNNVDTGSSRSYWDIARANIFTFFNNILFVIGAALIAMGRTSDAITSVGIGIVNAIISTIQEIRAKQQLDAIAVLSRPTVSILRDSTEKTLNPADIVQGDIIRVQAGDQVVVDGVMVGDGTLEMDESLLTGEPDLIRKQAGDQLFSGSFCVTGDGYFEATQVGADSFANKLTATAKDHSVILTPLQQQIDFIIRVIMLTVVIMSIVIFASAYIEGETAVRLVQIAAVLSGLVPYGLFLMIVVAYALGASTIAREGALVQQVNAVESLSNIDVLCTDKTGTLTANRLQYHDLVPLGRLTKDSAEIMLGNFVRSASEQNKTSEALANGLPGVQMAVVDEVPFASSRKWSALAFNSIVQRGVCALGAVEMLRPYLTEMPEALEQQVQAWSDQGLRVLLFAHQPNESSLHDSDGAVNLPKLNPLAVVSLGDELRPQAKETIETFRNLGIKLKVISGDNPGTVAALAKQAGFPSDMLLVAGTELAEMDDAAFHQAAIEGDIFGRISPEQKERIVDCLLQENLRVAMMGDGVNDVLPIKKASLGIAMESGSNATRNVADMILLGDSFAALRPAFTEGRRIIAGMTSALYLFLSRVATSILMIISITMIGLNFPFEPAQVALTTFTVGVPSFLLTLWARPEPLDKNLIGSLARFVLPVAVVAMLLGTYLYNTDYNGALRGATSTNIPDRVVTMYERYLGIEYGEEEFVEAAATISTQGALSTFFSYISFLLILFLEPPHKFFTGWRKEVSPDKRPLYLVIALFVLFRVIYEIPTLGSYFGILRKPPIVEVQMVVFTVIWFFIVRTIWRYNLLDRMLGRTQ